MTLYPDQIDDNTSLPPASGDDATSINATIDAIEAIEQELGLVPAGVYADVRTRLDILEARINNPFSPAPNVNNPFFISTTGVTIQAGYGDPSITLVPASPGSLFLRQDGYANQSLYQFEYDGYWHNVGQLLAVHSTLTLSNSGGNYTVTSNDNFIPCDTTGGAFSITLPSSPMLGKTYIIADVGGHANTNPVTVLGNGKLIIGQSTYPLNLSYGSVTVLYYGSGYSVI